MLLVELETTGIIKHVFCCLRGMMIYHRRPTAHRLEYLFVLSLFVLRMLDASAIDVYMVAGYLCLALAMWTEQDGNVGIKGQLKAENEGAR